MEARRRGRARRRTEACCSPSEKETPAGNRAACQNVTTTAWLPALDERFCLVRHPWRGACVDVTSPRARSRGSLSHPPSPFESRHAHLRHAHARRSVPAQLGDGLGPSRVGTHEIWRGPRIRGEGASPPASMQRGARPPGGVSLVVVHGVQRRRGAARLHAQLRLVRRSRLLALERDPPRRLRPGPTSPVVVAKTPVAARATVADVTPPPRARRSRPRPPPTTGPTATSTSTATTRFASGRRTPPSRPTSATSPRAPRDGSPRITKTTAPSRVKTTTMRRRRGGARTTSEPRRHP